MTKIYGVCIPRCIHPMAFAPVRQEIHTFADARELGYGAFSYLRSLNVNNDIFCSLMLGKTRVVPIKKCITIPRFELQFALLAAKQCTSLKSEIGIICDSYLWSEEDLKALYYIRGFVLKKLNAHYSNSNPDIIEVINSFQIGDTDLTAVFWTRPLS